MKEFYKTRIHTDIQEFYREMEGYAGLLEARIKQFKTLVERNEEVVRIHEAATAQTLAQMPEEEPEIEEYVALQPPVRRSAENKKKSVPEKKGMKRVEPLRKVTPGKIQPRTQAKSMPPAPPIVPGKGKATKPVAAPLRPMPVARANEVRSAMPRAAEPRMAPPVQHFAPPPQPIDSDSDDSAIAEELMKDLFAQDQVKLSAQSAAKKPEATAPVETVGERTMANFFSRIGKSVGPIVFGEKPAAAEAQKKAEAAKQPAAAASATKPVADFAEVLRRAEQIKAEKKAERERAEVEARAEFYAAGDTMSQITSRIEAPRETQRQDIVVPRAAVSASTTAQQANPAPARQSLAVKDLDQHTINFLIDSLKQENGYRKQALRALTENNIPLPEIARLSKIDIGELELMRQLGRF